MVHSCSSGEDGFRRVGIKMRFGDSAEGQIKMMGTVNVDGQRGNRFDK